MTIFQKKLSQKESSGKIFFLKVRCKARLRNIFKMAMFFFLILKRCELRRLRSSYIVNELPSFARFVKQFFFTTISLPTTSHLIPGMVPLFFNFHSILEKKLLGTWYSNSVTSTEEGMYYYTIYTVNSGKSRGTVSTLWLEEWK